LLPPAPGPVHCGMDPQTGDGLDCQDYASCQ
jgi:hypothetical protein